MARLTGDWQRAGRYIADRRAELRLTQEQVQERGGPSPATQRILEAGARRFVQASSVGGLEGALRWASGSIRAILSGGEPVPLLEPRKSGVATNQELIAAAHRDLDAIEEELDRRLRAARRDPEQLEQVLQKIREVQGDDVEG